MENLYDKASEILNQVKQAVVGKDDAIDNIFAAILAGGHILIEDMPGVGKTTMALSFAKAMGISKKRIQFTTDIMPSDLVGFSSITSNNAACVFGDVLFISSAKNKLHIKAPD